MWVNAIGGVCKVWSRLQGAAAACLNEHCMQLYPIHTTNRSEAKRTEAKRSEPYCRIRTIHTSTECAAMRIPQFASFHTAHSRMRFVSHWKRSEAKRSAIFIIFGLNRVVSLSGTTTSYAKGLTRERLRVGHHRPRAHVVGSAR